VRPLAVGWGKADEIRAAIERLRGAGRRTVALLETQGLAASKELFVAAAADEAYVTPGSSIALVGLAAEYLFLGGFWERLGVEFEVAKAGRYKSAVETFSERAMSEASREMANSLLDDTFDRFVQGLAEGRGLTPLAVAEAIDRAPVRNQTLEAIGLIDGERHLDQLLEQLGGETVRHERYARVDPEAIGFDAQAEVALIYGTGAVVQGKSSDSPLSSAPVFASETVSKAILDAAEDPEIDAIVLRIDSPGGSALASELIWRAIVRAREQGKPVIASFSDVAASGGYYVASAADSIVSSAGTLTGSIGVFALRPSVGGLLEKLEIGIDALTRGKHADYLVASERMSKASLERLQTSVLDTYQLFLRRVADGRALSVEDVDAVAQGRVWTGRQAMSAGLVDELGGLHTAVRRAKQAIGLAPDADVFLIPYPRPSSLTDQLFEALQQGRATLAPALPLPEPLDRLAALATQLPAGSPLLIPPVLIEIH
jgi:protease-4